MKIFNRKRVAEKNVDESTNAKADPSASEGNTERVSSVTVLGTGCSSCRALHQNALDAAKNLKLNIDVKYVTDLKEIMSYGVTSMPALVVDEKVVASGRVLKTKQIEELLANR
ncbi:MAG: thioredoxin family protein [Thermoguttaceae bacterium]|nr:thioredoxin family protein [Thermoguttaceae bacterium]